MMTRPQIARQIRAGAGLIDAHTHLGADMAAFYNGDFPYAISAEDHGVRLAHLGLERAVCFPFVYTNYFQLIAYRHGRFRRATGSASRFPYEFENLRLCREIYEAFPEFAGTLLPFAFFDPAREPAGQAAALRRLARRYPLFGLKTASSYLRSPITALLGKGACLLDLAAELDIPVTIHTSVLPADPWANVFDVLKVVAERPDVRFALAHTCRFDRRALDRAAALQNCFVDCAAFHIHCRLAVENHPAIAAKPHRFHADYRDHAAALQRIAAAYPVKILWGSDTPAHYWKSVFRDARGMEIRLNLACGPTTEADCLRKLPAQLARRIAHNNTVRFLFG
ncbi:MAG: amidohydrolase family protein [Lentisphaerae bacterium]|nr:amidohydrolase family protein [Lentisphaerota bacterium]